MSQQAQAKPQLLGALVDVARELPPAALIALNSALEATGECRGLARFAATPAMRDKLQKLEVMCGEQPEIDGKAIALALRAAAEAVATAASENRVEIVWTGPATEAVPLRRVDQAIYDLVEAAQEELLLVTYAAYRAKRTLRALRDATDRGVQVKLVIELSQESGGKIAFDALATFRSEVPAARVFYWPLSRRMRTELGAYGSMHAKCLVADRARAIVSSANLTDYALEANIELGLLVGQTAAIRLADHFDQLILRGELVPVP